MNKISSLLISVVVPLYNESAKLQDFHKSLTSVFGEGTFNNYEVIYCDDGSTDKTADIVAQICSQDQRVKLIKLSRNFGKENALSAGISQARGEAIIMIDGDGQHPVELIGQFIEEWQKGFQVVVGVRTNGAGGGWFKLLGSRFFYKLFNKMTHQQLIPGSTDFRLIDKAVAQAFLGLGETDRITRGLIDWLGFKRSLINFKANVREEGRPSYTLRKLMGLAANSFVSMTPTPLYMFGYLGVFITAGALLLGLGVIVEQLVLGDPWHWNFTGTAMLGILILFLVGLLLMAQGILSLYISHIHNQSKHRPLFVIDYRHSIGIKNNND